MNSDTEIASAFTVGRYKEIRSALDPGTPDAAEWSEVLSAFRRRILERFLWPISELSIHDKEDVLPTRPGFAILALDCLLIDTIQSFREGRVSTGEISPAASFKTFLKTPLFSDFKSRDREDFFKYVRNALLHNGETREEWKIRIDPPSLLVKDKSTGTRTINRRKFHIGVVREFRLLCSNLKLSLEARRLFLRRMDALCGLPVPSLRNLYFAYGSNLLEREVKRDAKDAEPLGVAFLPGYRLEFTKHANSRGGDAASIQDYAASMVWGFVYRLHDSDKEQLINREKGYREIPEITAYLKSDDDVTPQKVFTFRGKEVCPNNCGPTKEYLSLVVEGAKSRDLPNEYVQYLERASTIDGDRSNHYPILHPTAIK